MSLRIPLISNLITYLVFFWQYTGIKLLILLIMAAAASLTEGFGLALFIPVLVSTNIAAESNESILLFFTDVFEAVGVTPGTPVLFGCIIVLFLIKGAINFCEGSYRAHLSSLITHDLRKQTVRRFGEMDYHTYITGDSGFYANLITMEASRAVASFHHFSLVIITLATIGVYMLFSLWINWQFTIMTIVTGGLVLFLFRFISTLTKKHSIRQSREYASLHSLLVQTLHSFKYTKATDGFSTLQKRLQRSIRSLAAVQYKTMFYNSILGAVAEPIIVIFIVGLMAYQISILRGSLAPIVVSIMFFYRIFQKIIKLQTLWQSFSSFVGSIKTISEATNDMERSCEQPGTEPLRAFNGSISFDGVSFGFDANTVLDNVSLEIRKNTTVAVVGESGVGKTTLVDLITGILIPRQGRVLIDGRPLSSIRHVDWRRRIGYVTQDPVVFNDTVAANIALWSCDPAESTCMIQIRRAAERAHCTQFIDSMEQGYATVIGDRGVRLSGGQRQRIAIARELFKEPELLILDEATSALDAESEIAIQQSIDALKGSLTVVLIAHRISTLRTADYIYVLDQGRVVENGAFDELMNNPESRFRKMWELQNVQK